MLERSAVRRPSGQTRPPAGRSVVLTGVVAALTVAVGSGVAVLCLVLAVWVSDARAGSGAPAALQVAGQGWLLVHGAPVHLLGRTGGAIGLTPWVLALLPGMLLYRAGTQAARALRVTGWAAGLRLLVPLTLGYATVGLVVAGATARGGSAVTLWQAALATGLLALVAGGSGVLRVAAVRARTWRRVPGFERTALVAAGGAVAVLLGGGALLLVGALLGHLSTVGQLAGATHPGVVGGIALGLVCLALLPTAVVWGAAWATGAGFAVGTATAVTPFGVSVGAVPALPLLGAVPAGRSSLVALLGLVIPVLAGLTAAELVRRRESTLPAGVAVRVLVVLGAAVALTTGLLAGLAGGGLGPGRMAHAGPPVVATALSASIEVTLVAGLALAARAVWLRRRAARPAAEAAGTDQDD